MERYEVGGGRYMSLSNEMGGKMAGIVSINTSPSMNEMCLRNRKVVGSICASCYSFRMEAWLPNCRGAWTRNGKVLSEKVLKDDDIPLFNYSIVRINAQGDFINAIHYKNILKIIEKNVDTRFTIFTKRIDILRKVGVKKLDNVIYVYSLPLKNMLEVKKPIEVNKVFAVYTRGFHREHTEIELNCAGKSCWTCRICYSHNDVERVNELVKWSGDKK